ncbi:long-chain fatty acid--CoA ligase [Rhodohalobacter sp.]|uniref:AMP-dependent synthetase/ligase n=1 Tax=Rhodohalobacter sp. TaxID=1974210 RepID=UPI002ACD5ED5|nr:long-chain fatty acid--CoA ligase [Rhodohalobacter sp.]MDZ7756891.1 long-chain fatty acid--CoA ligase [Rhodohalobacter sp.]
MKYSPTTLADLLYKGLEKYSDERFSVTKRDGKWTETSKSDFVEKVHHFAMGLHELGVRPGDKVSIHAENCTEWLICDLAILSIGAANVPIYSTQPGDQIKYILENSEAKVHIVSNDEMFAETKSLIKAIKSVKAVISILPSKHKKLKQFDAVIKLGESYSKENPDLFDELKSSVKPDDTATIIYTSGTTGVPKGVMLTHNNIASNVQYSLDRLPFDVERFQGERVLSYLPLSHVFERMIEYMYISMGCEIFFIETIDEIKDDFLYVKPFFFATVPRLLEKVQTGVKVRGQEFSGLKKNLYYWAIYRTEEYDPENPPKGLDAIKHKIADKLIYSKIKELFGGNLSGVVSGGAALSPEVFRFMNAIGIICVQGYGLTETSPVISVQTPGSMRVGTSGKPLEDVEVKIADDKEILVRGPNVMKGYYKLPEQTQEVLDDDGWFKTGDVGKIDDEGYLYITDRKKAMFKLSTGKYVAPQNVENKLLNSGFIDQIVVIGYQKKFCSALIVPAYENVVKRLKRSGYTPNKPYSEDEKVRELIQKEVDKTNESLSPWERVKKFVLLEEPLSIDSGELTPTMKVKRSVVKEKYEDKIESMYEEE